MARVPEVVAGGAIRPGDAIHPGELLNFPPGSESDKRAFAHPNSQPSEGK